MGVFITENTDYIVCIPDDQYYVKRSGDGGHLSRTFFFSKATDAIKLLPPLAHT